MHNAHMERLQTWNSIPPRPRDEVTGPLRVDPISADRQPRSDVPPEREPPTKPSPVQGRQSDDFLDEVTALLDRLRVTGELRPVDLEYQQLLRATRHYQAISDLTDSG